MQRTIHWPTARSVALRVMVIVLLIGSAAIAQQAPYDVFPAAEPPYYRVRYEASQEPGKLIYPVNYTVWLPPAVKQLRGVIVHQHGCGEGSCKSGLTGAYASPPVSAANSTRIVGRANGVFAIYSMKNHWRRP